MTPLDGSLTERQDQAHSQFDRSGVGISPLIRSFSRRPQDIRGTRQQQVHAASRTTDTVNTQID
jgi:hypothetical protein